MVKAYCTRWLSHGEAVIAIKAELFAVYATPNYFVSAKKDRAAVEILNQSFANCAPWKICRCAASPFKMFFVATNFLPKSRKRCHYV